MPKVSDAELRFHAKSDGPQPLQDIARELLAAREITGAARGIMDWVEGTDDDGKDGDALFDAIRVALRDYDEAIGERDPLASKSHDEAREATRPTFAEALAAEAQQYNSRNVEWTELRSIIERARRASEGP